MMNQAKLDKIVVEPHTGQIEVMKGILDPYNFYTTAVISRQWGKSTLGSFLCLQWAINEKGRVILWVSPTDKQCDTQFKRILDGIIHTDVIENYVGSGGRKYIKFKTGSEIRFRSALAEDSLRGETVDYMIVDEAAQIKKSTYNEILLPMLTVTGKKCVLLTTPKGKNWIYDKYIEGLKDGIRNKSFRFTCYDSPIAREDNILDMKKSMSDVEFRQEMMAEFVDKAGVFSNVDELLTLNRLDNPIKGEVYYAGIDIGLVNDATVLSIIDKDGNLVNYFRWVNIESPDLINKIKEIEGIWKFKWIYIEDNNQGLPIYQDLRRSMRNISQFNTNQKTKPEIINDLIYLFNMKSIKLINDELLRIELDSFIFKQNDMGKVKFMADNGFNDDIVMSLAIGRRCYKDKKNNNNFNYYLIDL